MPRFSTLLSFAVLTAATALPAAGQTPAPTASATLGKAGDVQEGLAAFYGTRLNGRKTASGEKYDHNALTAAHKTLPFGARVRITNARNGRSVEVRINDRGPTQPNRIIDLSRAAATKLGMLRAGNVPVRLEVLNVAPAAEPRRRAP
ncbi:MAG: septal ring lytic transglycosylase RlpA family protein [Betaproteobacteria bacterium]|nr:septal ring lytic transglycosylase RlpA family protein [Betaproteobacteria bacterium]